jgi:hypothetical protein
MAKKYALDSKYVPLSVTKAGQTKLEQVAGARLKTLVLTAIIPDFIQDRIRLDTGRLQASVRAGDNGRYSDNARTNYGIELPIYIGGTEEESRYESKYGDRYGDQGKGSSRVVDYVAYLNKNEQLSAFGGDLFDGIDKFVREQK